MYVLKKIIVMKNKIRLQTIEYFIIRTLFPETIHNSIESKVEENVGSQV